MTAFYNEIDPYCAQWLRNLIDAGHIAPGVVDERSIEDITPNELRGYTQCHFFAGIGVWSYALRLAGWPDDRPVWTGSCPCQPFSAAGKGHGFADERHLWPAWHHLIRECRPGVVFGEQVASPDGLGWLDLVQADLEGSGYASGAVDLCAAGVGAPHIRQRLFFVADAMQSGRPEGRAFAGNRSASGSSGDSGMEYADLSESISGGTSGRQQPVRDEHGPGSGVALGNANNEGLEGRRLSAQRARELLVGSPSLGGTWTGADWLLCFDERIGFHWRPVEPGTFPLAHGVASRMDKLRAYGNAITTDATTAVIRAYMESRQVLAARIAA